jgi:hypothetical protein
MDFYSFKNQCARMVVIDFAHHNNSERNKSTIKIIPHKINMVDYKDYKGEKKLLPKKLKELKK